MRIIFRKTAFVSLLVAVSWAGPGWAQNNLTVDYSLVFPNAGFEQGLDQWTVAPEGRAMVGITRSRAAEGVHSLTIMDNDRKRGVRVTGPRVALPTSGKREMVLLARVFPQSGKGLYISICFRNKAGAVVTGPYNGLSQATPETPVGKWTRFRSGFFAPSGATTSEVILSSGPDARPVALLDDFAFVPVVDTKPKTPLRRTR